MYQSAYNNKKLTKKQLNNAYNESLCTFGNKVSDGHRFGSKLSIDYTKFLRIKYLISIVNSEDTYLLDNLSNLYGFDPLLAKLSNIV